MSPFTHKPQTVYLFRVVAGTCCEICAAYIRCMVSRTYGRGRPVNAPPAFIPPCRPTVVSAPPIGPGWAHELKHDGYRLQIHVRNGRVRLYTMNGNDWTKRYPRIVEEAARLREPLIIDAEVVHLSAKGVADFAALHSRTVDEKAVACAFDLVAGDDIRRQPLSERKKALRWVLRHSRGGIQYVEHTEGDGGEMFKAVCKLGLEGIVSKKLDAPYKSGPSKAWIKVKNPNAPAATRATDGTF
jgi:bifunctional non-homologous end joining protein LigD